MTEREEEAIEICELDEENEPMEEQEKQQKKVPRVPRLKNKREREEWINKYREWGIWHRNYLLGITYYRYRFPHGIDLIVEEYPEYKEQWMEKPRTEKFYHIMGQQPEDTIIKGKYYSQTKGFTTQQEFRHSGNCITEVIELLKYMGKKEKEND